MAVPSQLPFEEAHPLRVAPALRALQAQSPIHPVRTPAGDLAWLVTGYEEVRRLLADPRLGRSHRDPATAARTWESVRFGRAQGNYETEDVDHARIRRLLQPHFAHKRMRVLRPRVEALTTRLLDDLARQDQPADLVAALAVPLPILVICELLGVPYEDRDNFRAWSDDVAAVRDRARSEQGLAALFGYGQQLVARKRAQPGDDVISLLCATEGTTDHEIATLSMFLLFAGHESTVATIGMGALLLLSHPTQWQALQDAPALMPAAIEEMLRAAGKGGIWIRRYARAELEISGVRVGAGELVLLDNGAANHDETVFADPGRLDITRSGASDHLAFGYSARYCLGAPLARIELEAVFSQLIPRFPALRLAVPAADLQLNRNTLAGGLAELPVVW